MTIKSLTAVPSLLQKSNDNRDQEKYWEKKKLVKSSTYFLKDGGKETITETVVKLMDFCQRKWILPYCEV